MSARSFIKVAERFVIDNSPTLLTGVAAVGTVATALLTGRATFKAAKILAENKELRESFEIPQPEPTKADTVALVWKAYIPPAIAVAGTIGCVIGANRISASRAAAMAAAYALTEKNFGEYKDKVKEQLGVGKEEKIRAELAQDRINAHPPTKVARGRGGDTLCYDLWTDRYFTSDMQTIRGIENDLVKGLFQGKDQVVTLADFYDSIGLKAPKCSEMVGWNADCSLSLTFTSGLHGETPVMVLDFDNSPFPISGVFG